LQGFIESRAGLLRFVASVPFCRYQILGLGMFDYGYRIINPSPVDGDSGSGRPSR